MSMNGRNPLWYPLSALHRKHPWNKLWAGILIGLAAMLSNELASLVHSPLY